MIKEQINLIQQNFDSIAPRADAVATVFYNRLFEMKPALRLLFPADLTEQKKKLTATLRTAIKSLSEPEKLVPVLENLGRKHALYGVRDEHYDTVGAALLLALKETLGAAMDARAHSAWAEMYGFVAATMKRSAGELASQTETTEINSAETTSEKSESAALIAPVSSPVFVAAKTIVVSLFCCLIFGFAAAANAATFIVTNARVAGGLRQAILNANAGADTINFNIGNGGARIVNVLGAGSLGADADSGSLVVNDAQAGKIGAVVALSAGQTFAAGTRRLVNGTFQTVQTNLYSTPLHFVNQPRPGNRRRERQCFARRF